MANRRTTGYTVDADDAGSGPDRAAPARPAGRDRPLTSIPEQALRLTRHHERSRRRDRIDERLRRLTARDRELLHLLAAGRRATDIAAVSGRAPAAVRAEIRSMMATLEVGSQIEAVAVLLESRATAR